MYCLLFILFYFDCMISEIFILFYNIFIANFCDLKIYKKGLPKSMTIFDF